MARTRRSGRNPAISLVAVLLVIWLAIGAVAAAQRHYFSGSSTNCAKVGTTIVTILAGPLNYVGVNPKVDCKVPQPSK
jgi:hypothetical protein